jgi:hypothetical protein
VGVADELHLPAARRGLGEDLAAVGGGEAAEPARDPGGLGAFDQPYRVVPGGEVVDPVGGLAGGHQGGDGGSVDLDVVVVVGVVEDDAHARAAEAAFEGDAGPGVLHEPVGGLLGPADRVNVGERDGG